MAKSSKGRKKAAAKRPAPARRRAAAVKSTKKKAARKAPARAAGRKAAARKTAKKAVKVASRRTVAKKTVAKKAVASKTAKKAVAKKLLATKPVARKPVARTSVARTLVQQKTAPKKTAPKKAAPTKPAPKALVVKGGASTPAPAARPAPGLNRERRTVRETPPPSAPSTLGAHRHASAASSGADELRVRLASHTGDGPAITAGDVDANWVAAETVGDEAPGGDNPTPDQDVVDEIGRALGVEYDDDEELQGGDEIAARDHDRWELDPASSDDFDER